MHTCFFFSPTAAASLLRVAESDEEEEEEEDAYFLSTPAPFCELLFTIQYCFKRKIQKDQETIMLLSV